MDLITILLADDHAVLRAGLRLLINGQSDMRVIGEASNGAEALEQVARLRPHLVLLDLSMPQASGLEVLPTLLAAASPPRVLVLTMHDDEGHLHRALQAGAAGYVLKQAADSDLLSAIRTVMRGEVYVHPALTRALVHPLLAHAEPVNPWADLSERERAVLTLVARGHTSAEVAEQLSLSPKTVETYRARGLEKLGLRSRAALVQFALAHNLLRDDQPR